MNKFTIILSNIMSMALLVTSLPMVAAHPNYQRQLNAWDTDYNAWDNDYVDHRYLQQEATSNPSAPQYPPYYVFNQFNVIEQQPSYFTDFSTQQLGSPLPTRLPSYGALSQSSLAQNHYPLPQQQPKNPVHEHAGPPPVSDQGSTKPKLHIHHFSITPPVNSQKNKCPIEGCTKTYSRPSDLTCHIQVKHFKYAQENNLFSGKYLCPEKGCPARFTRVKTLDRHMKQHHPNPQPHYTVAMDAKGNEAPEPLMDYQEDDDDHGHQEQAHDQQPLSKFSLGFICHQ